MRNIVRTIYGTNLQTASTLRLKVEIPNYSTINEVMGDSDTVPNQPSPKTMGMESAEPYNFEEDSKNNCLQYFVIGNGGHRNMPAPTGGVPYTDVEVHRATDAGLFKMIPFVVRPVTDDLTGVERAKYRLRKTMMINGQLYAAYYARKLNIDAVIPEMTTVTVADGIEYPSTFQPTLANLKPTPSEINYENDGSFVQVVAALDINFSAQEIRYIREACALLYGSEHYAIISEIGFCSGVDKPVVQRYPNAGTQTPVTVNGGATVEAVAVQLNTIMSTYYPINYVNDGFSIGFDLGGYDPLFGKTIDD